MAKIDEAKLLDVKKTLGNEFAKLANSIADVKVREAFEKHCFFAGGCIYSLYNGQQPNDYDIFCDSPEAVEQIKNYLYSTGRYDIITKNAVSFDGEHQLVIKFIGSVHDTVDQFDFKHNMFAFKDGDIYAGVDMGYLTIKVLIFNEGRARDFASCITRVPKFVKRGFICTRKEMAKMLKALTESEKQENNKEIESIDQLIEGLGY